MANFCQARCYRDVTESPLVGHHAHLVCVVPLTILSVDDERDVTDLVRYHLSRIGLNVVTAANGRQALSAIESRKPDLLLLDLMLPDIDGFGVCEILRRQPETATIPIILLTAWSTSDARHLGLELGALDYLTKPFSPKELVDRVQRTLALKPVAPTR